jgi:hypothetical protein
MLAGISHYCRSMERMAHWMSWLERLSWGAAVVGTLITIVTVIQASNTFRMKATLELARPFVRALSVSLDKPEILAAYESECTTAKDRLRKKIRLIIIVIGLAIVLAVTGFVAAKVLPDAPNRTEIRFSVGDAAQQECKTTGFNWGMSTTCTNRWFLNSSGQRIQAEAPLSGPARQREVDVAVDGCSGRAQVRWELLADDEALGNGMAGSELKVPNDKSSLTVRAERIDTASCSAELVVKVIVWP